MTENKYYNKIIEKFIAIITDSKGEAYILRCGIAQGSNEHSYVIKNGRFDTLNSQRDTKVVEKVFIDNLREHLVNDKPFNFEYVHDEHRIHKLFDRFATHLYRINDVTHWIQKDNLITPTPEEFKKVLKCFEPALASIEHLVKGIPINILPKVHPSIDLVPIVMSVHNEDFYNKKADWELKNVITNEIKALRRNFRDEKHPLVAKGIKNYLCKKEHLLLKINNPEFEDYLYKTIQEIVHSDLWAEVALFLPSFKNKKSSVIDRNILSNGQNPISYIHLNKKNIFNLSPSVLNDTDLNKMLSDIISAVDDTRPGNIDFVQLVNIRDNLAIIISSPDITDDMLLKTGKVFEDMIYEYNSENIKKNGNDKEELHNHAYLIKVARVFWMELELSKSDSNSHSKRISKI